LVGRGGFEPPTNGLEDGTQRSKFSKLLTNRPALTRQRPPDRLDPLRFPYVSQLGSPTLDEDTRRRSGYEPNTTHHGFVRARSVAVAVVQVRVMRMSMNEALVPMAMRVRLSCVPARLMFMLVMRVVNMRVAVLHRLVDM